MTSEDDMQFAFESTQVLLEPDRRIDTFGSTNFEFRLVTELLDAVDRVRVREGRISAEKPRSFARKRSRNFSSKASASRRPLSEIGSARTGESSPSSNTAFNFGAPTSPR